MGLLRTLAIGVLLGLSALARSQEMSARAERTRTAAGPLIAGSLLVSKAGTQVGAIPYQPQPGDLVLCDDFKRFRHFLYKLAGSSPPTHSSMVMDNGAGRPVLLEMTGPNVIIAKVQIMEVEPRFSSYPGEVMVRRLKTPLTPEQSRELTQFAYAQEGKSFALARVALQVTPFTPRNGLRKTLFGRTYFDRNRWLCSELVVAAGCKASLFDPNRLLANATYPRDLAFDEKVDLSHLYHPAVPWVPAASSR